jgi:hypothetical protein
MVRWSQDGHPRDHRAGQPGRVHRNVFQAVTDTGVGPTSLDLMNEPLSAYAKAVSLLDAGSGWKRPTRPPRV